ncbi:MAG: polyribonucleotide nucleotidyltransferase, partial [Deltaproteobacteria bacterium]|nr:polyribonucleotide nucleotidyltransferase [Deltaproteobacteria bacterium]
VISNDTREGIDFLPLSVEYMENSYAGGKFPGNFFRRDMGRPSEKETLTSRLIDRPLRPLFPDNFVNEIQVLANVLSTDKENEADILAILGASAALEISDAPFQGPIAAVRVGRIDGEFVTNPTVSQQKESDINLIVAANRDAVVMVEGGAEFATEADMIDAIFYGHQAIQPMLDMQDELRNAVGKSKREITTPEIDEILKAKVVELMTPLMQEVITTADKMVRQEKKREATAKVIETLSEEYEGRISEIKGMVHDLEKDMVRKMILEDGKRIDNRSFADVRPIECMVGILPRVHGSALFTRGETQGMVLTTLGTERDQQRIESIYGQTFRNFIFHYNFPPFSVGEVKRVGSPSRRDIGHGALARRALLPVLPDEENFQYSIRVVSEIMESNGSSSMASVCGGSMSLMDAGVPIKDAVAGVAMGLVADGENIVVLTDILGDEDHYGDMDFKVTGTKDGITALQMDIKIDGVTREVMKKALDQAKDGRLHILEKMQDSISRSRSNISEYAPVIKKITIKQEKIKVLIGPGGKVIREISSKSDSSINVDDDGNVVIASPDEDTSKVALKMIGDILQEAEQGKLYMGTVRKIMDFGAFVEIFPGTDGLIHISQLDKDRVNKVTDILHEGDKVLVKVIEIDRNGKIALSRKAALGESLPDA